MTIKNQARLQFISLPENISFARACSAAFVAQLDCTLEELEEIKLVVSEAVSNSIIHGYENQKQGLITIEINLYQDKTVEIMVEDQGRGIADIEQALQPAYSSHPERMGLGFVFMKSLMDDLDVTSEQGQGTRVKMRKTFIPVDGDYGS